MKRLLSRAAAGLVLALGAPGATAQSIPARPFALIVPWPAGGATDTHLGAIAQANPGKLSHGLTRCTGTSRATTTRSGAQKR